MLMIMKKEKKKANTYFTMKIEGPKSILSYRSEVNVQSSNRKILKFGDTLMIHVTNKLTS
jgi:hypothetical protein